MLIGATLLVLTLLVVIPVLLLLGLRRLKKWVAVMETQLQELRGRPQ